MFEKVRGTIAVIAHIAKVCQFNATDTDAAGGGGEYTVQIGE